MPARPLTRAEPFTRPVLHPMFDTLSVLSSISDPVSESVVTSEPVRPWRHRLR